MSVSTAIEWNSALEQCGGDVDFLKEILGDFVTESAQALQAIVDGMRTRQFVVVMKAGHQIKGSASYLSCGDIMRSASLIQNLGNEGAASAEALRAHWQRVFDEQAPDQRRWNDLRQYVQIAQLETDWLMD